jgi:uncharacterized membrane protein
MKPIRVKAYGVLPLTKPVYLAIQGVGLIVAAAVLVVLLLFPQDTQRFTDTQRFKDRVLATALDNAVWIVLAVAALEGVETYFMLRKFKRKEAEQRRNAPPQTPPNS